MYAQFNPSVLKCKSKKFVHKIQDRFCTTFTKVWLTDAQKQQFKTSQMAITQSQHVQLGSPKHLPIGGKSAVKMQEEL